MMMPEAIFRELVPQIVSTGDTWFPFFGTSAEVNFDIDATATSELDANGDPIPVTLPCAVLTKPITMTPITAQSNYTEHSTPMLIYFVYDTDLDEYQANKFILQEKARKAAFEFTKRLRQLTAHVASIVSAPVTDFDNTAQDAFFDTEVCGVVLRITAMLKDNDPSCFPNVNNDVVNVYDEDTLELIVTAPCRTDVYIDRSGSGGDATVTNSNDSYTQSGPSPLELPDTTFDIYVNGVLDQSFSVPTLKDEVINISP